MQPGEAPLDSDPAQLANFEEPDPMNMRNPASARPNDVRANNWGQSKQYGPHWQQDVPQTVLQLRDLPFWPPEVMNLSLAVDVLSADPAQHDCRWVWRLVVGTGGASRTWFIDAKPLQQVSLSAETLEVSLVAKPLFVDSPFQDPNATLSLAAFISRGNTSGAGTTYTESVATVASGNTQTFKVPPGAVGWRITGPHKGSTNTPFAGNVSVIMSYAGFGLEQWDVVDMYDAMIAGDYVPLISGATTLSLFNSSANDIRANIIWQLDL